MKRKTGERWTRREFCALGTGAILGLSGIASTEISSGDGAKKSVGVVRESDGAVPLRLLCFSAAAEPNLFREFRRDFQSGRDRRPVVLTGEGQMDSSAARKIASRWQAAGFSVFLADSLVKDDRSLTADLDAFSLVGDEVILLSSRRDFDPAPTISPKITPTDFPKGAPVPKFDAVVLLDRSRFRWRLYLPFSEAVFAAVPLSAFTRFDSAPVRLAMAKRIDAILKNSDFVSPAVIAQEKGRPS